MTVTWSMRPSDNWAASDLSSPDWIPLPRDFAGTVWADREGYVSFCARAVTLGHADEDRPEGDRLRERAAATVRDAYDRLVGRVPAHLHFLYWPDGRKPPLPVFVGLWKAEHDREPALAHYSGAADRDALEPPVVEPFAGDHLGEGLRVLRFDRWEEEEGDSDPRLLRATVAYAWRSDAYATDVQLWATTPDVSQLFDALPALDVFARSIRPVPDPGT